MNVFISFFQKKKKKNKVTINQNIQKLNIHKEEKPQKRNPNAGPIYVEQLKTEERLVRISFGYKNFA